MRELELARYGYTVDAKDPAFFSPFPNGTHLFMWQDRAKTLAEIAKFSRRDAETYPKYEDRLERLAIVAESLLLTTPPNFPPKPGDWLDYLKLAGRMKGLSRQEIVALVKIFTQSAADFLDEWFESEELKVTLATDGVIGANGGPSISRYRLHSPASLHGRREWPSRPVGIRPRRHGRCLKRDRRFRPRSWRDSSHQRAG